MKKSVAVIGAKGYVGQHLCDRLIKNNMDVLRFSAGDINGISLTTGLFPESFSLPSELSAVYFLAQSPHYRNAPQQSVHLLSVNCIAATQAAEAARRAGIKRFIYASTGNVYKPSFTPISESSPVRRDNWYALSKVMAEDALALYRNDLDVTITRIFGVYGPGQKDKLVPMLAGMIQNGKDISIDKNPTNPQDQDGLCVSLLYIDDLTKALLSLLTIQNCEVINLAGAHPVSIRSLATELSNSFNLPLRIQMNDTERAFNLISDTQLQVNLLGNPMTSLAEGIQQFCNAYAQ